jgi:hypothetical protein
LAETVAVLLIHADDATHRWVREALPEDEFAVTVRRPTDELGGELGALRPQVALVDTALLAGDPDLRQAVLAQDPPCLLLALVLPGAGASATDALERGADDVIVLPLSDAALRARLRSGMRLVHRTLAAHEVRGEIGPAGALGILKHCEDHRLSGRLIVEGSGRRFSAEFFGGELMGTGWQPPTDGEDDLATLLALREGCYLFVQSAVDPLAPLAGPEAATEAATELLAALAPPAPIVTKVKGSPPGVIFEVRTTGENRPRLTISTVILRDGHELRQMETSWPHPIESDADLAQAWAQMVQQHERVMAKLREVTDSLRRAPGSSGGVDGTLLGWALHFVVEQAWAELGTAVTASLLGRTQRALALRWPHLAHFRVGEGAQVTFDLSRGPTLVADAVDAVAAWLAAFLRLAREVSPGLARLDVRQSTSLMAGALDGIGFYAALEAATARAGQDAAPPDAATDKVHPASAEPAQPATQAAG